MRAEAGLAACVRGGDSRACDRDRDGARDGRGGARDGCGGGGARDGCGGGARGGCGARDRDRDTRGVGGAPDARGGCVACDRDLNARGVNGGRDTRGGGGRDRDGARDRRIGARDGARDRRHGAEACRLIGVSRILSISL